MMDEISVIVVKRKDRKNLCLRYTDPVDGKKHEKNSGTTSMKVAQRAAGEWQAELRAGTATKITTKWSVFTEAYETAMAVSARSRTMTNIATAFNAVEKHMKPDTLARITPQWVGRFQRRLLESCEPATVESYCRHLKAALNWAKDQGWTTSVPKFPKLKNARSSKQMKGRPITGEEFDRMLAAVDDEFSKPAQRDSFRFLLRGLWLSGLRLGEALSLTWSQWADGIRVDLSGKYAKLLISAEDEKGGRDRVYPVTPDFAEFLRAVPEDDRNGFVFEPCLTRGVSRRVDTVSKAICRIGERAGIKVDERKKKPVWASAHDLRRAFGARWSRKVNSMVLKELMRHASVATTEKYYVGIQSDETSALLAGLMPNSSAEGDVSPAKSKNDTGKVTNEVTREKKGIQPMTETPKNTGLLNEGAGT